MSENINTLLAFGQTVTLSNGREQKIIPFKFRQFGQVMATLKDFEFKVLDEGLDFKALLAEHSEQIIKVVQIATNWPEEEVADLYIDDMADLVIAILEVNNDFFVQRVTPRLANLRMKK